MEKELIKFEVGKVYFAEYPVTCYYKGFINQCGSDYQYARCDSRTDKTVTFTIIDRKTGNVRLTKRGRIVRMGADGGKLQEFVYLKKNGVFKDFTITSEQCVKDGII